MKQLATLLLLPASPLAYDLLSSILAQSSAIPVLPCLHIQWPLDVQSIFFVFLVLFKMKFKK
jgi:hypothetical protein